MFCYVSFFTHPEQNSKVGLLSCVRRLTTLTSQFGKFTIKTLKSGSYVPIIELLDLSQYLKGECVFDSVLCYVFTSLRFQKNVEKWSID